MLGGKVGFVHVGMDCGRIQASVRSAILWQSAVIGLVFVVALIGTAATVRMILRPLAQLTSFVERAAKGSLPPVADEAASELGRACSRGDEVGHVARAFRQMVLEVTGRTHALASANETLEERVRERTLALTAANDELVREVGERRRAEEAMRQAKATAEEANRSKSEFLANMSHEIRTPMNGIFGMTELALLADPTDQQREYLLAVKSSADVLLRVINDILDFSKIEAGKLDIELTDFSLRATLASVMRTMALAAHEKQLELAWTADSDVPNALVGDPVRLRQILTNLVGNAVKFTEQGEVIVRVSRGTTVDCQLDEKNVARMASASDSGILSSSFPVNSCFPRFSVRDTGIGIPADKLEHIFAPFEQADGSTTRRFGGTGLGLTISSRLARMMGGRIHVESIPGSESTFHLVVPFARATNPTTGTLVAAPAKLRGLSVLVVDDNATSRHILRELLEGWHMRPTFAEGGGTALMALTAAKAARQPFGLVLLDMRMPAMDGFVVAEWIQRHYAHPIVVMLTSVDQGGAIARCRTLNIAAHLVKPINPSELLESIRRALEPDARYQQLPPLESTSPAECPRSGLRILLAEDNEINQAVASAMLQHQGHAVAIARNGKEALAALARQAFDLVLMDVQMPEMGGLEATATLRRIEQQTGQHMPVIALTAHTMKGDRERCLEAGMDGYLCKPIHTDEIRRQVASVLTRSVADAIGPSSGLLTRTNGDSVHAILPVLDRTGVLQRTGNDRQLLKHLAELFVGDYPRLISTMKEASHVGDRCKVAEAAHSLKGALATLGGVTAYQAAVAAEAAGRGGDFEWAADTVSTLEEETRRFQQELIIWQQAGFS
jgi:two-component system, sensor histidine kinase and response regulator